MYNAETHRKILKYGLCFEALFLPKTFVGIRGVIISAVVQKAGHAEKDRDSIIWFKCCTICNNSHIIFVLPVLHCLVTTIFVWASFFTGVHYWGSQKGDVWRVASTKTAKS